MSKTLFAILLLIIIASSACGSTIPSSTQPPTPQSATAAKPSPEPEPISTIVQSATFEPTAVVEQTVSAPSGLQVVYLREGNLWSWTDTNDNVLLTGTGDMSTARLSEDGRLLAFMRGPEVWTIRMDGTEARPLIILEEEGGALWFTPDGSLLAVSTADHIDVIDLINATTSTVLTYPAIPNGYYPEVVWSADATGFKTVIPPSSENGQAEFLFVMVNGTKASLAKFSIVHLSSSLPFISPDGGYVIYAAKMTDDQESLYVMDSSGAAQPYGEPAENIRAHGWLPDSKRFLYEVEKENQVYIGEVTAESPVEAEMMEFDVIRWLDAERFLALQGEDLYLGETHGDKSLIAEGVSIFDFGK